MKNKELIKILKKHDSELEVFLLSFYIDNWEEKPVNSVEFASVEIYNEEEEEDEIIPALIIT
jgi:hypothetical protein